MKKILAILFFMMMIFSLVACGSSTGPQGPQGEPGPQGPQGPQGEQGETGQPGEDGKTPTIEISEDGYWVINGVKTEYRVETPAPKEENPQGLAFYLKDDGTYAVAIGNANYLSEITIPSSYNGRAVTEIADYGFRSDGESRLKKSISQIP